ncbi:MAG: HupE/UreJ family protein [Cyclobacteriaceae bacterium]|nr:HupE/UreJ family protein [Cyclobacteriaceae bacterium]
MSEFQLYFGLGRDHILDFTNGYDHILFVLALCAVYVAKDWKQILILITAFTIGHSITLALSTLDIISVNPSLIELLIPITIFITAFSNLFRKETALTQVRVQTNYVLALLFGLIHGMGFSNYLKALLGKDKSILTQLFAFNVGLEFGQIIIVGIFLSISFIAIDLLGTNRRDLKMVLSSAIAGISLILIKDRLF